MKYFKSEQVKVFPCSYRGIVNEDGVLDTSKIIDPESRLSTEKNLTQLGRIQNAASDTRSANSGIEEEIDPFSSGAVLKCVIDGYHFEITLRAGDFPRSTTKIALGIKTKEVNLIDDVKTTALENLNDSAVAFLDGSDDNFYGIGMDNTTALKNGGYKFVEILNSEGQFNKDNLIGNIALDVTPSQELYADKDGKIKSFDITYGIRDGLSYTKNENKSGKDFATINYLHGFNRTAVGYAKGTGYAFSLQSGPIKELTNSGYSDIVKNQGKILVNGTDLDDYSDESCKIGVTGLGSADSPRFENLIVDNNLSVKALSANNIEATGTITTNALSVTGASTLKENVTAEKDIKVNGTLTATTINGAINGKVNGQGTQYSPKRTREIIFDVIFDVYTFSNLRPGLYAMTIDSTFEDPYQEISQSGIYSEITVMISIDKLTSSQSTRYRCLPNDELPFALYKKNSYNNNGEIRVNVDASRTDFTVKDLRKIIEY